MNFNILFFLLIITSCGLKGNPIPPQGSKMPSIIENFEDIEFDEALNETQSPN